MYLIDISYFRAFLTYEDLVEEPIVESDIPSTSTAYIEEAVAPKDEEIHTLQYVDVMERFLETDR